MGLEKLVENGNGRVCMLCAGLQRQRLFGGGVLEEGWDQIYTPESVLVAN